jgi:hypothetical protein
MVDTIVGLTVVVVLALAAINALQGLALMVRLVSYLAQRHPHYGLGLWLPAFTSPEDVRAWLGAWREVLCSGDLGLAILRAQARQVIGRHVYLTLLSNTWAMAVNVIAPALV